MRVQQSDLRDLVLLAKAADPSIDVVAAQPLLATCLAILDEDPTASAAEVARRCVARHPDADASWVAHLARAATGP